LKGISFNEKAVSGFLQWFLIILMLFTASTCINPAHSAETVLKTDSQRAGKSAENGVEDQSLPARPKPEKLINNLSKEFPDFLKAEEAAALEEKLRKFNLESSNQI
jgi:hypothetical protein